MRLNLRIVGHELVSVKEGELEFDMLKVKLRGQGDDKRTVATVMMDTEQGVKFPLGDIAQVDFEILQQRLPFKEGNA